MSDLKPCPFCGNDRLETTWTSVNPAGRKAVEIACGACGAVGPSNDVGATLWNDAPRKPVVDECSPGNASEGYKQECITWLSDAVRELGECQNEHARSYRIHIDAKYSHVLGRLAALERGVRTPDDLQTRRDDESADTETITHTSEPYGMASMPHVRCEDYTQECITRLSDTVRELGDRVGKLEIWKTNGVPALRAEVDALEEKRRQHQAWHNGGLGNTLNEVDRRLDALEEKQSQHEDWHSKGLGNNRINMAERSIQALEAGAANLAELGERVGRLEEWAESLNNATNLEYARLFHA